MIVHHVFIYPHSIHAVYSVKAEAVGVRLGSASVTKVIKDGTVTADPVADHLVGTDGRSAVRIASLGKPVPDISRYGMNVVVNTDEGQADLSIDVIEPETPGVVEGGDIFMSNPDPEAAHLLGDYDSVWPDGTTFSVVLSGVIPTEDTPSYFMINRDGAIREITFEEAVDFRHRR